MTSLLRTAFGAALCLCFFAIASNGLAADDPTFEALARKIPGFRLILNKPKVPDTVFFDAKNKQTSLRKFDGNALLINFWATWCTPCVREMPALNTIAREFKDARLKVVAIASGQQVGKDPAAFLKEHELDALALYKDPHASLMTLFDTRILPTTLLADRSGRILGGVMGEADWNSKEARAVLAHLANSP